MEQTEQIADSLRILIERPELREYCAGSAFNRAKDHSWQRCARKTFSFLTEVKNHQTNFVSVMIQ
jgi:glycosyltransferase involved in cell wall biosynthesis